MNIIQKPSPNFGSRDGNPIKYISVHIMAGTLSGTDAWFANPQSQASSNYGVGFGGEIHQYVDDSKMAFANGGVKNPTAKIVKENLNVNQNRICLSIESEGYDLAKAPDTQINALVELIKALATKYNLPIDREHIIGHREINSVDKPTCPSSDNVAMDNLVKKCQSDSSVAKKLVLEIEEKVAQLKKEIK